MAGIEDVLGGKEGRKTQGKGWRIRTTTLALAACCDDHEDRNAASVGEKWREKWCMMTFR